MHLLSVNYHLVWTLLSLNHLWILRNAIFHWYRTDMLYNNLLSVVKKYILNRFFCRKFWFLRTKIGNFSQKWAQKFLVHIMKELSVNYSEYSASDNNWHFRNTSESGDHWKRVKFPRIGPTKSHITVFCQTKWRFMQEIEWVLKNSSGFFSIYILYINIFDLFSIFPHISFFHWTQIKKNNEVFNNFSDSATLWYGLWSR